MNDNPELIQTFKDVLRNSHRVKHGTDYAVMHKYGETHVVCNPVWVPIITEVAAEVKLVLTTVHQTNSRRT